MDSPTTSSVWSSTLTPTASESGGSRGALVTSRSGSSTLFGPGRSSSVQPLTVAPPSGPVRVTSLDVSSWHPRYPVIGQFAMTASQEVVAAGPDGLFSFKRVNDHASKPWSNPRPFPGTPLDSSSVSGIALHESTLSKRLDVFCVANGNLYTFSRSTNDKDAKVSPPSFVADSSPPLATYRVSGSPATTTIKEESYNHSKERYSLVVPSRSGGLLHTSIGPKQSSGFGSYSDPKTEWEPVDHVATHLGVISAVTTATLEKDKGDGYGYGVLSVDIVAVCIAQGRLHSVEGPFTEPGSGSYSFTPKGWKGEITHRIHHPGEVTGNPMLLQKTLEKGQLDLLVPSAAGGIFHFVRTPSTPDEWHMIGRIGFPNDLPPAGSLAFFQLNPNQYSQTKILGAALEIGGRLYIVQTTSLRQPWSGCHLYPVTGPGPSYMYH
ncbi:unnamed protein product [Clonostachys chloroleuca]|uniref:Uncharacterized protein n=1 Tax=Clonostachys chloroleuca TaxID=1926264 RepID=A0AA35LX70_9HYPO|nr:unnamed protein product [Clonostachys chloroleuca]